MCGKFTSRKMTRCASAEHGFLCEIPSSPFNTQPLIITPDSLLISIPQPMVMRSRPNATPISFFKATRSIPLVRKHGKTSRATDSHITGFTGLMTWIGSRPYSCYVFDQSLVSVFIGMFVWFDLEKMAIHIVLSVPLSDIIYTKQRTV